MKIPAGAACLPDYIDATTEAALERHVDPSNWLGDLKRRVQHYGYRYDYKARRVTGESYIGPLPLWLLDLADRLARDGIFPKTPDQVIVNEYLPGQGIAPHVDCRPCFGNIVASLSLGSPCVMEFRDTRSDEILAHTLEPRSLLILGGEARFDWKHGNPARKSDLVEGLKTPRTRRLSLTFRTVIREDMKFPPSLDSNMAFQAVGTTSTNSSPQVSLSPAIECIESPNQQLPELSIAPSHRILAHVCCDPKCNPALYARARP